MTTLENMNFIAAVHNALPALIAEVRRLNAALSEQTARAEKAEAESAKWERVARWLAGQLQDLNTGATANDLIHHAQSEIEKERRE